jgi:GNAT superfamily N-acetyltransferase
VTLVPEGTPGATAVTVTWLQMLDPDQLRPARRPRAAVDLARSHPPEGTLARWFYENVGADWQWVDRLGWTDLAWQDWVERPGHELWSCTADGATAGYFELDPDGSGSVELAYFGLLPGFEGRGIGGWLLTRALERAWTLRGATRVYLHTCTLDGAAALPNYLARGLTIERTTVEPRMVTAGPGRAGGSDG